MAGEAYREAARLVLEERWGALATVAEGAPLASMVAYAPEPGLGGLVIFVSQLAAHTRHLLAEPACSLAVTRPDTGTGDPQLLPRISLQGRAEPVDDDAIAAARSLYLARFPDAAPRFELADFVLFRFVPVEGRYVGGFARALRLTGAQLSEAAG